MKQILKRSVRHKVRGEGKEIMVKGNWADGGNAWTTLDIVRLHDPWVAIAYGGKSGILHMQGWEWAAEYLGSDQMVDRIVQTYKVSATEGRKFKFGTEVPKNVKHAFALDRKSGTNGWRDSLLLEISQLLDFETFVVVPDGEPMPSEYKRIPHSLVFDVKFDGRLKSRLVAGGQDRPS